MKKLKSCFVFILLLAIALISNVGNVNAANTYTEINSVEEIPAAFENSQSYISSTSANLKDYIGYFTGSNAGWEPRIKYLGTDPNNIANYLFCLSYHDYAPSSKVTYTKADYDTAEKMNQVRYIIENGFGGSYATYDDLKYAYYVTQLALWQLQGSNGFDISNFSTNDTVTKNAILNLVNGAKEAEMDTTKYVAKYVPTTSGYQILVPNIIYTITPDVPEDNKENEPEEPEEEVIIEKKITSVAISYKDKCTDEYVTGAKMRLVNSEKIEVRSWTSSNSKYYIDNLEPGVYTLEDITNDVSMEITVVDTTSVQNFTLVDQDMVCDVEEEEKEEETITETIITEVSDIVNPQTGIVGTATVGSLLSGAVGLYIHSKKKLKDLNK